MEALFSLLTRSPILVRLYLEARAPALPCLATPGTLARAPASPHPGPLRTPRSTLLASTPPPSTLLTPSSPAVHCPQTVVLPDTTAHQATKLSANGQVMIPPTLWVMIPHPHLLLTVVSPPLSGAGSRRRDALLDAHRLLGDAVVAAAARDGRVRLCSGASTPPHPRASTMPMHVPTAKLQGASLRMPNSTPLSCVTLCRGTTPRCSRRSPTRRSSRRTRCPPGGRSRRRSRRSPTCSRPSTRSSTRYAAAATTMPRALVSTREQTCPFCPFRRLAHSALTHSLAHAPAP